MIFSILNFYLFKYLYEVKLKVLKVRKNKVNDKIEKFKQKYIF